MNVSGQKIALTAGAAVDEFRAVKIGAADSTVIEAVDAAAAIVGVSEFAAEAGAEVTVQVNGVARVKAGGVIARGSFVTATTDGVVVAAAPATGANAHVLGIALATAADGDEIPVLLSQGVIQGAA